LMGVVLFLPIPFTNFFFAIPLAVLAFSLIERDGTMIVICWVSSFVVLISVLTTFYFVGDTLVHWIKGLF
jgi:hypothetical protein